MAAQLRIERSVDIIDCKERGCYVTDEENEIDRSKSCPHLLRLFWKNNRNNPQLEYKSVSQGKFPSNEIQIYTWPDATLREISDLLKSTVAVARQRHVTLSFDLVYPDRNGVHVVRHVSDFIAL